MLYLDTGDDVRLNGADPPEGGLKEQQTPPQSSPPTHATPTTGSVGGGRSA
jgi:hypothetical protein